MRYPDIKDIVNHIYHDYMTRCEIIIMQNKMMERSNGEITAWCDDSWLNDFAEDIKSAFDEGCFVDIDEGEVPKLKKEYGSENIIELVEDYYYHNKKILRITYHPETPDIVDAQILNEMTEQRQSIDANFKIVKEKYEQLQ